MYQNYYDSYIIKGRTGDLTVNIRVLVACITATVPDKQSRTECPLCVAVDNRVP